MLCILHSFLMEQPKKAAEGRAGEEMSQPLTFLTEHAKNGVSQREDRGPPGSQLESLVQEWPVSEVLPGVQGPAVCRQERCSWSNSCWAGGALNRALFGVHDQCHTSMTGTVMVPQKLLRHMPGRWAGPRLPLALGIVPSGSHSPPGKRPPPTLQVGSASERPSLLPGAREVPSAFPPDQGPWEPACGVSGGATYGGRGVREAVPKAPAGPGETEDAGVQLPSPAPSAPWVSVAGGGSRCGLCWSVVGGRRQFLLVWAPGLFPGPFS